MPGDPSGSCQGDPASCLLAREPSCALGWGPSIAWPRKAPHLQFIEHVPGPFQGEASQPNAPDPPASPTALTQA